MSYAMKLFIPALFLFLMLTFNVTYVFQGEALISEGVVASGSSATIVSLNLSSVIYILITLFLVDLIYGNRLRV